MPGSPRLRFEFVLKVLVTLAGVYYTILFFALSIPRLLYPYEIEWFEGSVLDEAARIVHGKSLFAAPSIEMVSLQYQPLYYYAAAFSMHFFGITYFSGRLVSFVSIVFCAVLILYFVQKKTGSWWYGFIGVSLFFAAYGLTGYYYDLALVDSLMLLFLLASIISLRIAQKNYMIVLSAIFLALAFLTKQDGIIYALPLAGWLFIVQKKKAAAFSVSLIVFLAVGIALFSIMNGRWYWYFTFQLPAEIAGAQRWETSPGGLATYLLSSFAAGTLLVFFFWTSCWQNRKEWTLDTAGLIGFLFLGCLLQLSIELAHSASYKNLLMPVAAIMAIGIPYLAYQLIQRSPMPQRYFIFGMIFVQLGGLFYSFRNVPMVMITKKDFTAGEAFINEIRTIPGNVFFPQHGFLPLMAGKKTYANLWPQEARNETDSIMTNFQAELDRSFTEHFYDAIILDESPYRAYDSIPGYTFSRLVNHSEHPFVTRAADAKAIPRYLFVPKK